MSRPVTVIDRDPNRIDEALAWYQNGTLSEDDRAWVEQRLAADPALRERLDFDRRTAGGFEALAARVPADIGWAGLEQRIRADLASASAAGAASAATTPAAAPQTRLEDAIRIGRARHDATAARGDPVGADSGSRQPGRRAGPSAAGGRPGGLFTGFMDWLGAYLTPQVGAALATLLIIQTVAVGFLVGGGQQPDASAEYRTLGDARPVTMIRVLFDESVTERQLREGLVAQRATIVEGPNALGEYWIATRSDPQEVARALQQAGLVASYVIDQRVVPK